MFFRVFGFFWTQRCTEGITEKHKASAARLPLSKMERGPGGEVIFALLILLAFILNPSSLKAQLLTPEPHLTLSGFNDSWGGGFTQIKDDLRSFGFEADYQFYVSEAKVMQTRLRYSGLTNRYAIDSSRLDELELLVRYPIFMKKNMGLSKIIVSAEGGGYLTGNLGGSDLQNSFHNSVDVAEVALAYPGNYQLYPMLGASLWYNRLVFREDINLIAQANYRIAPNYLQYYCGSIGLAIKNYGAGDQFSLSVAYQHTAMFSDDTTRLAVANAETGFSINYDMRVGLFNYGIRVYPATKFAVGTIGISILSDNKKYKYIETGDPDMLVEFGALLDGGLFIRFSTIPYADVNIYKWLLLGFETRYQYWTYGRAELGSDPNQLGHYQQATIGYSIQFFEIKPKMQLLPYVALGAGFRGEYLYKADNQADRKTVNSFLLQTEGGLRLKFPSFGFDKNCYYGLSGSWVASYSYKEEDEIYYGDFQFGKTFYQFSIGGFAMIDF